MLDDFADASRKHGFRLVTGVLSTVFNSKSLVTTAGASLAAVLCGQPLTAGVAAATGTVLEVGKVAIEFANKKHSLGALKSEHQLAFIIYASEQLSN
jgi:hypothetical protein